MEGLNTRKESFIRKLNTKGCCFLCLQNIIIKSKDENRKEINNVGSSSLKCLFRYLKLNPSDYATLELTTLSISNTEIEVNLCEMCEKLHRTFLVLFQHWEKIQMEMDFYLEKIHCRISQAGKVPELVENYSRKMTSDPETLAQLAFVDKLRKQIADKSLRKKSGPTVCIQRAEVPVIVKPEVEDFHWELEDPLESLLEVATTEIKLEVLETLPVILTPEPVELAPRVDNQGTDAVANKQPKERKRILRDVVYVRNPNTRMYHCKVCAKIFKSRGLVRRHFDTVHLKRKYTCGRCQKVFTTNTNLWRHLKTCGKEKEKHRSNSKPRKPAVKSDLKPEFGCELCKKMFVTKDKLRVHVLQVHKNVGRYPCDLCDKKFKLLAHLKEHKDAVHFGVKFYCRFCNKMYACKSKYRRHEKSCPQKVTFKPESFNEELADEKPEPAVIKMATEEPTSSMTDENAEIFEKLQKEWLKERKEKAIAKEKEESLRLLCSKCGKTFSSQVTFCNHQRLVHLKVRKFCGICKRGFTDSRFLAEHEMAVHQKIKNFPCKFCGRCYSYNRGRLLHQKTCPKRNRKFNPKRTEHKS